MNSEYICLKKSFVYGSSENIPIQRLCKNKSGEISRLAIGVFVSPFFIGELMRMKPAAALLEFSRTMDFPFLVQTVPSAF